MEDVLSSSELGEFCLLSWTKVLRMWPSGGLYVAAMLAASWEDSAACAHGEDKLGQGNVTIPQDSYKG